MPKAWRFWPLDAGRAERLVIQERKLHHRARDGTWAGGGCPCMTTIVTSEIILV